MSRRHGRRMARASNRVTLNLNAVSACPLAQGDSNEKKALEESEIGQASGVPLDQDQKRAWTEEDTQRLFMLYKVVGTRWSIIAQKFEGRTENDVKNRFYTTLKRVATRAQLEDPNRFNASFIKCKTNLLQFVDAAVLYGQMLSSKRGRKKNTDKKLAEEYGFLFRASAKPNIAHSTSSGIEKPGSDNNANKKLPLPSLESACALPSTMPQTLQPLLPVPPPQMNSPHFMTSFVPMYVPFQPAPMFAPMYNQYQYQPNVMAAPQFQQRYIAMTQHPQAQHLIAYNPGSYIH